MVPFSQNLPLLKTFSISSSSKEIETFLKNVKEMKCIYYASDLLSIDSVDLEKVIVHTEQILTTLDISTDDHIRPVFRGSEQSLYKDWKLSKLACMYLLFNGDPTNLASLAHQQTELINQMLGHIHT